MLSTYIIGDRGTNSPVLSDPKALLFDITKNLLVIPVDLAQINKATTPPGPSAYGTFVWQGAYVFNITLTKGFVLTGSVTQITGTINPNDGSYWNYTNLFINRSLYIGNTLYTISNAKVQLNDLKSLAKIAEINLN